MNFGATLAPLPVWLLSRNFDSMLMECHFVTYKNSKSIGQCLGMRAYIKYHTYAFFCISLHLEVKT